MLKYANMNIARLWCKITLKINVEQTERNERTYLYLYSFGNLVQRSFQKDFYMCIE